MEGTTWAQVTPSFATFWNTGLLIWNYHKVCFNLFSLTLIIYLCLEESWNRPAQRRATDSTEPPKPLAWYASNLERCLATWRQSCRRDPDPRWPESKPLPLTHSTSICQWHIQISLRTWENETSWKGHWALTELVEDMENNGDKWGGRWKEQGPLHCVGHQGYCIRVGVDGVKIWASHTYTRIRYPSYQHKQNWEKQNIIWLYFKLPL